MLNRFKLVVFAIILAVLTILFFQNRAPLSIKFLCSDTTSEYCLYQTPSLPLAVWMAIFIVAGIFSSLVWQLLNKARNLRMNTRQAASANQFSQRSTVRSSYREQSNFRKEKDLKSTNTRSSASTNPNNFNVSDWEQRRSEDWEPTNEPNFNKDYDVLRQSSNIRPGETNYSEKFKKDNESNSRSPRENKTTQSRDPLGRAAQASKENLNSENSQSPLGKNADEVYDANYRTLNDVPPPSTPEDTVTEDEDADWI